MLLDLLSLEFSQNVVTMRGFVTCGDAQVNGASLSDGAVNAAAISDTLVGNVSLSDV